jgi:hypothetical protein
MKRARCPTMPHAPRARSTGVGAVELSRPASFAWPTADSATQRLPAFDRVRCVWRLCGCEQLPSAGGRQRQHLAANRLQLGAAVVHGCVRGEARHCVG